MIERWLARGRAIVGFGGQRPSRLQVDEAEACLKAMILKAGLDDGRPSITAVWPVLMQFCTTAVDCESDKLLFQCGVYDSSGDQLFEFELVRQFCVDAVDDEGHADYDHMEQLSCTWYSAPTGQLNRVKFNRWADEKAPISVFFWEIESYPIYHMLKQHTPEKFQVAQDWV